MKKIQCLLIGLMLSACNPTYHEELERNLEGKTAEQKRVILAQECSKAIGDNVNPAGPRNVRDPEAMRRICEEMTGQKISKD